MGRRRKPESDKKIRVCISMTPLQKEKADLIARITGISTSELCCTAIEKEFKRLERIHGKSMAEKLPIPGQMNIEDYLQK